MRSRPTIELHMPPVLRPGETVDARVVLHEATETPINDIRVSLDGSQQIPYGKNVYTYLAVSQVAVIPKHATLAPGRHEYFVRFQVPLDAPLSHVGSVFSLGYVVRVHVDIPWWPDARDTFNLAMAARPRPRPAPRPLAQTTANGAEPFLELSLDDTVLEPGESIGGAIAAGNLDPETVRRVVLRLIIEERALHQGMATGGTRRYTEYFLAPGDVARGAPLRFLLKVPLGTPCGFETPSATVRWWFEARIERRLRSDLNTMVPLEIGAFTTPRSESKAARALLGNDRWRARWEQAGARLGLALAPDELVLRGEIAGVDVEIAMDPDGLRFAITLRYAPLGIDLDVAHRRLPFGGIDVDDAVPTFGRRFRIAAREAAQARAVLAVDVRRYLLVAEEARLEDGAAHLVLPGVDRDRVAMAVDLAEGLATALARVRSAIPPPASMAAAAGAWQRTAETHHGVLSIGAMRLDASSGGTPFSIATVFDDARPVATRLSAKIDPPLPAAVDLENTAELGARSREVAALAAEVCALGQANVEEQEIRVILPRSLDDAEEAMPAITAMLRLVALLQGRAAAGPYR